MAQTLESNDMLFHTLIVGGTGSGKTNAILYMLDLLFKKKVEGEVRPGLFLFDPAGDASIDLFRSIPSSEWSRVTILDPQYVSFGFNPLSLPENTDPADAPEVLQAQVEEFSSLLSDVFNTDATNAPRLMWIFKGALYYLYTFTPDPTLWELYNIMLLFTKKSPKEVEELLRRRVKESEIIRETMEAISRLPQDAYSPVLNRISHFVLPPTSITFRMFCSRKSTIDLERLMEPGRLTIFRIPTTLPGEFRKLFSAAVVMKLYFASLKRAKRLEREGKPPTARTPVVLAADEFRDVSQMRILRTILSQSRKFGLYLWMVVQTLTEVPEDLMGAIQANVGSVLAFRGSPDDARKLAKVLYPQKTEAVEALIPGLEDYAALVRKRPVGGRPVEPPFRVTFPKLREPVHDFGSAIGHMRVEMEKAYGGTVGDTDLVYRNEVAKAAKESGDCPLDYPLYWVPLTYLHCEAGEVGFSEISKHFEESYNWSPNTTQTALGWLVGTGRLNGKVGQGESGAPDPKTNDARKSSREVFYSLTARAKRDFFDLDLKNLDRAGGPEHIEVMRGLLEEYWKLGYWCVWDKGDRGGKFPDILVTPPLTTQVKGKEGRQITILSTEKWDLAKRTAVEIETDPSKNFEQLRENYDKDMSTVGRVRFVVLSDSQELEVTRILQDKDRNTFETVVRGAGLPTDQTATLISEDARALLRNVTEGNPSDDKKVVPQQAGPQGEQDQGEAPVASGGLTPLRKSELWILAKVCRSGYPGRSALAADVGVTERQVTRYLDTLEARGLMRRDGNGYGATEGGRRLIARAGWTFDELPESTEDLRVDKDLLQ